MDSSLKELKTSKQAPSRTTLSDQQADNECTFAKLFDRVWLLEPHSDEQLAKYADFRLPRLPSPDCPRGGSFRCACKCLDVDQQRALYLSLRQCPLELDCKDQISSDLVAARCFNWLERNKLARRISSLRKSSLQSGLYKLEELLREANANVGQILAQTALMALKREQSNCEPDNGTVLHNTHQHLLADPATIRAPVGVGANRQPLNSCRKFKLSQDNRSSSGDSGICLFDTELSEYNSDRLKWHLRLKSSARFQLVVSHSIELFQQLINSCELFKLAQLQLPADSAGLGVRQLRLLACVECQRLRSSLRYKWITDCLLLAYSSATTNEQVEVGDELDLRARQVAKLPRLVDCPQLEPDREQTELQYAANQLAILMGLLVREYLLRPALERWYNQLSDLAQFRGCRSFEPRLFARLELLEPESSEGQGELRVSQVKVELKEALSSVVDELASICQRLPRLDSQLESMRKVSSKAYISVLQPGDQLVGDTKRRLERLIDDLAPTDVGISVGASIEASGEAWIGSHYLLAMSLVSQLRLPDNSSEPACEMEPITETEHEPQDDRLARLRLSCKQIRRLVFVQGQMERHAARYVDLAGLVRVDCEPLRVALIRCLRKERLLLVRIRADEQTRLMERIRLQLDEIELGSDLETAIEDYLNERWQARNQAVVSDEQRLILDSNDELGKDERDDFEVDKGHEVEQKEANLGVLDSPATGQHDPSEALSEGDNEEELLLALEGGNAAAQNQRQQMLAITAGPAPATPTDQLAAQGQRQVPALVESRLLMGRYAHMARVLHQELGPLRADVRLALEGLIFQSELGFHPSEVGEPNEVQDEALSAELAARSRELSRTLAGALDRLDSHRAHLARHNELRSRVLNKLVVEFHQLMRCMGDRHLQASTNDELATSQPNGKTDATKSEQGCQFVAIQQLDSIQESADLARKLLTRHRYLACQNRVLLQELALLGEASLNAQTLRLDDCTGHPNDLEPFQPHLEAAAESRTQVLDGWAPCVTLLASLWTLAEEFETQQVKWLNSDTKRLDFGLVERQYESFRRRLSELSSQLTEAATSVQPGQLQFVATLELNSARLGEKLAQFSALRLPVFKFLTNRNLTDIHWRRLAELLVAGEQEDPVAWATAARACTTLAQFLELPYLDRVPVDEFERLNRCASVERELTHFLEIEQGPAGCWRSTAAKLDGWLDGWTESELELAARSLLEARLPDIGKLDRQDLARLLVATHALVRRHLELTGHLGLLTGGRSTERFSQPNRAVELTLRSHQRVASAELVRPAMLVEFMRLFVREMVSKRERIRQRVTELEASKGRIVGHLGDIDRLVGRLRLLQQNELQSSTREAENSLIQLERDIVRLELEREILATREASATEQQRGALRIRDVCIRQISERAIPALRAAAKALDCLDGRSLRALRCLRPQPAEPVRLVVEAVCLLRSCATGGAQMGPERRFDALQGRILEDYWPVARRQLNGTHSSRFLADLRRLDKKSIPNQLMRLIRRQYLSQPHFKVQLIERVSREAALLARWLIAVDVFDRVMNVVRPSYKRYMEAESRLAGLLAELAARRRQIELIGAELQVMEESSRLRLGQRVNLVDSLEQCERKLALIQCSRLELEQKRNICQMKLDRFARKQRRLAYRCLAKSAKTVYIDALEPDQRRSLANQLTKLYDNYKTTSGP